MSDQKPVILSIDDDTRFQVRRPMDAPEPAG